MNKQSFWINVFVVGAMASLLVVGQPVFADEASDEAAGGKAGNLMEEKVGKMYDHLGLTPQQKEQLKSYRQAHKSEQEQLRQALKEKHEQLRAELSNPSFDENKVRQIHNEIKDLRSKMEDHHLNGILEVRKVLTPEQFTKLQQLKEERKKKSHHRFDHLQKRRDAVKKKF